jgi:hypothetical protein
MLRDGSIGGKELMGVARGFEPLPASLPVAGRLRRVLGAGVERSMLPVFHPWKNFSLSRSVAFEFVGDAHARHVKQPLEELTEELLRGLLIPPPLDQDSQHVPILIDRPSENMTMTFDRQQHLIHVPFIAWARAAATQLVGILVAKLAAPLADRLIRYDYTAFKQ